MIEGPTATKRFNTICAVVALLAVSGPLVLSLIIRPKKADFGQFYMGGLLASRGHWDGLYPIPIEGAHGNAGFREGSKRHPVYERLSDEAGVGDANRFIQPPPMALLLAPLSLWDYETAHWVWTAILILCGWTIAWMAGHYYAMASGRPSWVCGALMLMVAGSPLVYRSIREAQVSPMVAVAIGLATMAWFNGQQTKPPKDQTATTTILAAASILVGSLLKYAPAVLVLLALITRRGRLLLWLTVLGLATLLVSLLVMGAGPYRVFAGDIAPTLVRSFPFRGNQSLTGFILRVTDRTVLSADVATALKTVSVIILATIVILLIRARRAVSSHAAHAMAAAAALLVWMLLFSPICWEHYFTYLCPFWGWLLWEAGTSARRRVMAWFAISLSWLPWAVLPNLVLPEPLTSHMLVSLLLILTLALARLAAAPRAAAVGNIISPVPKRQE